MICVKIMSSTTPAINCISRIVVMMFTITTPQLPRLQASLSRDGVEEYNISRRGRYDSFRIIYKTGFECPSDVCAKASAWAQRSPVCSCSCKRETPTFLPELGSCGDTASVKNSLFGNCSQALGLESGKISDSQLNAPSSFIGFSPSDGRLNNDKAWCTGSSREFFEIDLKEVRHLSAIATQGFQGRFNNYVKTFEIKYSHDGGAWLDYKDKNGSIKKFIGNNDTDNIKYNHFEGTFETRLLRIYPKKYNTPGHRCLRVEVYGCSDNAVCSRFFEWPFFLKSLNLANEGQENINSADSYQGCQVVPGNVTYYNYLSESKWARVYPHIFKVERALGELVLKWTNGSDKNLLGRIVRVVITCNYSASASRPPKTACLVFKSSGPITHVVDDESDTFVSEPVSVTVKPSSVAKTTPYSFPMTRTLQITPVTVKESSTSTGKEDAKSNGNYSGFSGVIITVTVGCAVVFGIFLVVLVVFCERRKLKNSQRETNPAVMIRNPVVEIYDQIPVERPIGRGSTSVEQDSQSTYQGLVYNSGQNNGGSMNSISEDNNGYCHVYQSVDKNTPVTAASVYQNVPIAVIIPDYQNVQTLEEGTPYASVHSRGSQTESAYEPLKGPGRQNVYEPMNIRNY